MTNPTDPLVEKLRARRATSTIMARQAYADPLCVEVADEIERLQALLGEAREAEDAIRAVAVEKPDAVAQFLIVQEVLRNPATIVRFRAGFLLCREYMARFVEAESPTIAASIRANWLPSLGDDPGPPRIYNFDEVFDEEKWEAVPVSANREASCEAAAIMVDLGMTAPEAAKLEQERVG